MTALTGREPEPPPAAPAPTTVRGWGEERVLPLTEPAVPLATARVEADATLDGAAKKLLSLLGEIHARAPLAQGGKILPAPP